VGFDPPQFYRDVYFFKHEDGQEEEVMGACQRYLSLVQRLVGDFRNPT